MADTPSDNLMPSPLAALRHTRKRAVYNLIVRRTVTFAGWFVLLTLATLIWHLLSQTLPLFSTPKITPVSKIALPGNAQVLQLDALDQGRALIIRDDACRLQFLSYQQPHQFSAMKSIPTLCTEQIEVLRHDQVSYLARLGASGIFRLDRLEQFKHRVLHTPQFSLAIGQRGQPGAVQDWQARLSDAYVSLAVQRDDNWTLFWVDRAAPARFMSVELGVLDQLLLLPTMRQVVGVRDNRLIFFADDGTQLAEHSLVFTPYLLSALPNDRSFLLADEGGELSRWSVVNDNGKFLYQPAEQVVFTPHIRTLLADAKRNTVLLFTEQDDMVTLNYVTGEVVAQQRLSQSVEDAYWHDKSLFSLSNNILTRWDVSGMSGVNGWRSFWQPVRYEGYGAPEYVWQTTYASDQQNPKYSLVPLVTGSLKAALMALMVAIPLALSAAIYTGFFAPARLRGWIKPAIELLEAIPTVVIGFIAAIWLTPLAASFLLTLALFIVFTPLLLFAFAFIQRPVVYRLPARFRRSWEFAFVTIFVLLWGMLLFQLTPWLQPYADQLSQLLWPEMGGGPSSNTTLVVALALGIAIAPSIFSLAEDAIFEVPKSMKQASFALGATRLQTLRNVVLLVAFPGILSAIMLGFGRAFGETMIVLMVTGNTPIASWDPFEGLRAMTANLAIELPESEVGSAHYQVLFFTALILFVFTFVINSFAELLRSRLRKRYRNA